MREAAASPCSGHQNLHPTALGTPEWESIHRQTAWRIYICARVTYGATTTLVCYFDLSEIFFLLYQHCQMHICTYRYWWLDKNGETVVKKDPLGKWTYLFYSNNVYYGVKRYVLISRNLFTFRFGIYRNLGNWVGNYFLYQMYTYSFFTSITSLRSL